MAAGVRTSVAQYDALLDRVLAFGSFIDAINGGLGDAVIVSETARHRLAQISYSAYQDWLCSLLMALERCRANFARDGFELLHERRRGAELEGLLDTVQLLLDLCIIITRHQDDTV